MKKILAMLALAGAACSGYAVSPGFTGMSPHGGQRGSELTVEFRGDRLADAKEIIFYSPGFEVVKIEETKDKSIKARIKIAADCRLGEHGLRIRTSSGVTPFRTFYVGPFPNVEEKEPNNDIKSAQKIELNSTIEGVVDNEDVDFYQFEAKKGQRISFEVEGMRLGYTMFDPFISVHNADGSKLAESDDTSFFLQDPALSVLIPKDGTYFVQVRETTYAGSGNSYYRLHVGNFPRPLAVYPAGGKAGEKVSVKFIGDAAGDFTQDVALPAVPEPKYGLPIVKDGASAPSLAKFRVSNFPNVLEAEPNNDQKQATQSSLEPPLAFNGILGEKGDIDWFSFKGVKNQAYQIEVYGVRVGSPIDSVLNVYNAKGNSVAGNDDAAGTDSSLRFTPSDDGEYFIRITDQRGRGGPNFVYRVEITKPEPEVVLNIPEVERNDTQSRQMMVIPRGNRFVTLMNVKRVDFRGDVEFLAKDLPAGVSIKADKVPQNLTLVPVVFEAKADAPIGGKLIDFDARWLEASKDGAVNPKSLLGGFRQTFDMVYGNPNNTIFYQSSVQKMMVAVVDEAPFTVKIIEPKVPLVRDGTMDLKIEVARSAGYDEPINVYLPFRPPGVGATSRITIEKGHNTGNYTINANGNAETNNWHIVVLASGTEKGGTTWVSSDLSNLQVASQFLSGKFEMATAELGKPVKMTCKLDQLIPFEGKATVHLVGLPANTTAVDKTITKDDKEVVFDIETTAKSPVGPHKRLFATIEISKNSETINQTFATSGLLRIDAPKTKTADAGTEKLAANKPGEPAKKTGK